MSVHLFSDDQLDALQEVFNIAIGQAGSSLATYLDAFVKLSVPHIELIQSVQLSDSLIELIGKHNEVSVIRQSFYNSLQGESLTLYREEDSRGLASIVSHSTLPSDSSLEEMLLDISNTLVGACLKGVAEQFNADLRFTPPTILCSHTVIEHVFDRYDFAWENALLIKITFRVENRTSIWYLLFFVPAHSIDLMRNEVDKFLG